MTEPTRQKMEELGQRVQAMSEPNPQPVTPKPVPKAVPVAASATHPTLLQRLAQGIRSAAPHVLPIAKSLLPLVEGNVAGAAANLLNQQKPATNLEPIVRELHQQHSALAEQHSQLSSQMSEQNATLRRVEDQLEQVREATTRNTLEQRELVEDLHSTGRKLNIVAAIGILLLLASIGLNMYLFFRLQPLLH